MTDDTARHIALSGAYNIRDLGGYRTSAGGLTRARRVLRADSPHRLTDADIDTLLKTGLATVIDLRAPHEVAGAPTRLAGLAEVETLHIPLFDALAPETVHSHAEMPGDDPLLPFYASTLAHRQSALREVLQAIAEAQPGAVMFHCTAGKDRTGLVSALTLGAAGVTEAEIVADYARSKALIADLVAEFLELARRNGTDLDAYKRVLACRPETMRSVLAHLQGRYGSVPDYLAEIGLSPAQRRRLAARLLA